MFLYKNKHHHINGFTLIELLVVISIVSLLSSVVTSSVNQSREKADVARMLEEMNSLRNAIEQYRLDNGKVPYEMVYDPTYNYASQYVNKQDYNGSKNLENTLSLLVPKYIPKIPHSPRWPKNTRSPSVSWPPDTYFLGYANYSNALMKEAGYSRYYCGDKPVDKYIIYFYSYNIKLNLPRAISEANDGSRKVDITTTEDLTSSSSSDNPGTYCISG
jgi:prepilin-type N-terminal cleavage/methylation domain-containing protein